MNERAELLRLKDVRLLAGKGRLAFEADNRAKIESYWQAALAKNPRLWNGPFFMFEDVRLEDGILTGTGRATDFATFLYWRDNGQPETATHITGTSMPVMADGALFAVRMAAHTANAGHVYFPAGSFDADDLIDGYFDVSRNIARELAEETGLEFDEATADPAFMAVRIVGAMHITRRNRLPFGFEEGLQRLQRHQAETGDDEVETAVAIRRDGAELGALKYFTRALADWHFENPSI